MDVCHILEFDFLSLCKIKMKGLKLLPSPPPPPPPGALFCFDSEAAVSFVLDWRPESDPHGSGIDRLQSPTPVGAGGLFPSVSPVGAGPSFLVGVKGVNSRSLDSERREAEGAKEERERQQGREALMRLGIFLERHEVHEDTVDVLSSGGWL